MDLDKVENDLKETQEKLRQNLSSLTSTTKAFFGQKLNEEQKSLKIIYDELSKQSEELKKQRSEIAYILGELSAGKSISNDKLEKYQPSLVEYLKEIGEDGWEVVSSVITRTWGEGWISSYSIIAKRPK